MFSFYTIFTLVTLIVIFIRRIAKLNVREDKMAKYFDITDKRLSHSQDGILRKITGWVTMKEIEKNPNKNDFTWRYEQGLKKKK